VEDADLAIDLGADLIGLNFYPPSPRSLTLDRARTIRSAIGTRCEVVGVFVNASRRTIEEHARELALDYLQFHGDETDEELAGWRVKIIRALRLPPGAGLAQEIQHCTADYVLLDTYHPSLYGGTGQQRSFSELQGLELSRVMLSGGLGPANVARAVALKPYAVDVASGVESAPGIKDAATLRSFFANAKSAG
jgi:phosphoribosylanthranilate isomerase